MMIHFIASRGEIKGEIEYYRAIVDFIKRSGHQIASDWIEGAYKDFVSDDITSNMNWRDIDKQEAAAISRADLIVVEATKRSFFVGYRVSQATQQKKPVIILTRDNSFPGAIDFSKENDFVCSANYTRDTLSQVLIKFFDDNTLSVKDTRFNFILDRKIYNYLRWASFKTGKTKARIVRDLLNREIEKQERDI